MQGSTMEAMVQPWPHRKGLEEQFQFSIPRISFFRHLDDQVEDVNHIHKSLNWSRGRKALPALSQVLQKKFMLAKIPGLVSPAFQRKDCVGFLIYISSFDLNAQQWW